MVLNGFQGQLYGLVFSVEGSNRRHKVSMRPRTTTAEDERSQYYVFKDGLQCQKYYQHVESGQTVWLEFGML